MFDYTSAYKWKVWTIVSLKNVIFVSKECIFSCFHQNQYPLFLLDSSIGRAPSGVGAELLV